MDGLAPRHPARRGDGRGRASLLTLRPLISRSTMALFDRQVSGYKMLAITKTRWRAGLIWLTTQRALLERYSEGQEPLK